MRKILYLSLLSILIISVFQINFAFGVRPWGIYTPKDEMINKWFSLCDQYPYYSSYEVIGHSIQGRPIYLFAIGNPEGGRVMYDGQLHGWEDGGTECLYVFAEWLLESQDPTAVHILQNNYNLFIPIVNVDTILRQNMRREYVLTDGSVIDVPYGVDLNRNAVYGWGTTGSGDPTDNYDYRGSAPASEPEIQAIRFALEKYLPQIYLNTHLGSSYITHRSNTPFEDTIETLLASNFEKLGVTPYPINSGLGGGMVATDADESFGASGWLIEIEYSQNMPDTLELFLQLYYPRLFAVFLSFNQAVCSVEFPSGYALSVTTSGQGSVLKTPNLLSYSSGTMVELTAVANAGWTFDSWSGDISGNNNPVQILMDSDKSVTAIFTQDPTAPLFEDGFESGSFSAWSGTTLGSGETASVSSAIVQNGDYSACFTTDGGGGYETSFAQKDIPASSELYAEGFFYVSESGIEDLNDRFFFLIFASGRNNLAYAGIRQTNSGPRWILTTRDGTGYVDIYSSVLPSWDQWYNVELHWKKDSENGLVEMWVDGVLTVVSSGIDTAAFGDALQLKAGIAETYRVESTTVYADSIIVSSNALGSTEYNLIIDVSGSGVTNVQSGSYLAGSVVEILATPNAGWQFDSWLLDNNNVGSINPIEVTMNDNHNLVALFTETEINQVPVASANGPYVGIEDVALTFNAAGSSDPDGESLLYKWDFGDGTTLETSTETAFHTYRFGLQEETIIYTINLVVNDGKTDSIPVETTATITGVNDPPIANTNGPYLGLVGEEIIFDATGSSDEEGDVTYTWDFGDEVMSSDAVIIHSYEASGPYTVYLTITDSNGVTSMATTYAQIEDKPAQPSVYTTISMVREDTTRGRDRSLSRAIATVSVTLDGIPLKQATVYGSWSGALVLSEIGTTTGNGEVTFKTELIENAELFTFTIDRIEKDGVNYALQGELTDSI